MIIYCRIKLLQVDSWNLFVQIAFVHCLPALLVAGEAYPVAHGIDCLYVADWAQP